VTKSEPAERLFPVSFPEILLPSWGQQGINLQISRPKGLWVGSLPSNTAGMPNSKELGESYLFSHTKTDGAEAV